VVAVGGDGTAHEVVNGILRAGPTETEIALLPRGTGRDYARSLGIPSGFEDALRVARHGFTRTVDVGRADYATSSGASEMAYFANFAGAGISGAIARRANSSSKALGGRVSFLVATLAVFARWRAADVTISIDGEAAEHKAFEVLVANGEFAAGGMKVCPGASPDDRLLDVLVIGDVTKVDFALTFPKIYRGKHIAHRKVTLERGSVVTVESPTPLPVVLDGEQPGTTPARFEVVPRVVRVRVPRRTA
jgi:diacylglycerol kinase (ATP)